MERKIIDGKDKIFIVLSEKTVYSILIAACTKEDLVIIHGNAMFQLRSLFFDCFKLFSYGL